MNERTTLLQSLLVLDRPTATITAQLQTFPWDSDVPLVTLRGRDAKAVLQRYLSGELNREEIESWANALETREDVQLAPTDDQRLRAMLHELANPILTRELTRITAEEWVRVLSDTAID
ncbi:MAG: hypothetical protein JWM95_668 [Gemmatimonadetes bacterium]|nr:hypothetical protein [Gemmatimonadota bacterium]